MADAAKAYLVPGSIGFLLVGASVALVLLLAGRRTQNWGRGWLAFLVVLYWALSLPAVSSGLVQLLSAGFAPFAADGEANGVDAVVVLGGGGVTLRAHQAEISLLSSEAGLRVLEAARVARITDADWVIASGGMSAEAGILTPESEILRDVLMEAGVPGARILLESDSHSTHEQAVAVAALLAELEASDIVLVTSPDHMRRAVLSFRGAGLDPIPAPALLRSESLPAAPGWLLPSLRSLQESAGVFRELLGLCYYALRGWF